MASPNWCWIVPISVTESASIEPPQDQACYRPETVSTASTRMWSIGARPS